MEQRKNNSSNRKEEENDLMGFPIHNQVRKIKQEYQKIKDMFPPQPEMRLVLPEITRQLSRSPLGIAGRAIVVGD
ncbi:hypothetical protein HHK36_029939 [Tetracentron sinense]|uniref:Uncharacterized protein n=1 Tax=Tetracentron sinense TaxID=13715 RepID=A0A834YAI6_TETSI|nr:hypothetical protein HHK36_029939 [Tetracentron sinense]